MPSISNIDFSKRETQWSVVVLGSVVAVVGIGAIVLAAKSRKAPNNKMLDLDSVRILPVDSSFGEVRALSSEAVSKPLDLVSPDPKWLEMRNLEDEIDQLWDQIFDLNDQIDPRWDALLDSLDPEQQPLVWDLSFNMREKKNLEEMKVYVDLAGPESVHWTQEQWTVWAEQQDWERLGVPSLLESPVLDFIEYDAMDLEERLAQVQQEIAEIKKELGPRYPGVVRSINDIHALEDEVDMLVDRVMDLNERLWDLES